MFTRAIDVSIGSNKNCGETGVTARRYLVISWTRMST